MYRIKVSAPSTADVSWDDVHRNLMADLIATWRSRQRNLRAMGMDYATCLRDQRTKVVVANIDDEEGT